MIDIGGAAAFFCHFRLSATATPSTYGTQFGPTGTTVGERIQGLTTHPGFS